MNIQNSLNFFLFTDQNFRAEFLLFAVLRFLMKYFKKCADVLWLMGVCVPKELCSLGNFSNLLQILKINQKLFITRDLRKVLPD